VPTASQEQPGTGGEQGQGGQKLIDPPHRDRGSIIKRFNVLPEPPAIAAACCAALDGVATPSVETNWNRSCQSWSTPRTAND
jgi:hypothetical protein